mmetsp:Transcript_31947/g.84196  ORF Transcript_31947/g.84196 Transcript_31947/m.84196 type:complete len:235 (-) Transcript_31947:434-1138(-)
MDATIMNIDAADIPCWRLRCIGIVCMEMALMPQQAIQNTPQPKIHPNMPVRIGPSETWHQGNQNPRKEGSVDSQPRMRIPFTPSILPILTANCMGVSPSELVAFMLAPASNNSLITCSELCLICAAICRGVVPVPFSAIVTDAPNEMSERRMSMYFLLWCTGPLFHPASSAMSGVCPLVDVASRSDGLLAARNSTISACLKMHARCRAVKPSLPPTCTSAPPRNTSSTTASNAF